jgi:ADP-ribose pyrophosphatase YjhB (NUDIX family)
MYKKQMICLNCDIEGHTFKNCSLPIRSYGIIAYRVTKQKTLEYLLIQRKDTIGKIDFMRGKYKIKGVINYNKLKSLIEEMTDEEKYEILNTPKEDIWDNMWLNHNSGIFKNEKYKAMSMFKEIDYKRLIKESIPSRYSENEWGFPKGRKNLSETYMECSRREFKEETGLKDTDFILNENKKFTEEFIASDGLKYIHIYYLAKVNSFINIDQVYKNLIFRQEVKKIGFYEYKTAYKMFRDYDTKKKNVLMQVNDYLAK